MELHRSIESMLCDSKNLTSEDRECLAHLTPQGMAKLNHDLVSGISLKNTMAVLRRVFMTFKEWRQRTLQMLSVHPTVGRHLRQREGEPFSIEELVFLSACHQRGQLNETLNQVFSLEECANEYFHDWFNEDAQQMQNMTGVQIQTSRLAPTVCPQDLSTVSLHFLHIPPRSSDVVVMKWNPVVSWFQSTPNEKFLVSCDVMNPSTLTPQNPRSSTRKVRFAPSSSSSGSTFTDPSPATMTAGRTTNMSPIPWPLLPGKNPLASPKLKSTKVSPAPGPAFHAQAAQKTSAENFTDSSWSSFGASSSEPSFIGSGDEINTSERIGETSDQTLAPPPTALQKVRRIVSTMTSKFRARHQPPQEPQSADAPAKGRNDPWVIDEALVAAAIGNRFSKPASPASGSTRPSRARLFASW